MSDENSEVIKENEICGFSELVQLNISKANKKGDSPIKAEKWNEQLVKLATSPNKRLVNISVVELLNKNKKERNKMDIKILASILIERCNFFKKLKEESDNDKIEALAGVMNLEIYNDGDYIINFGEEGSKFYIIIEGRAGVYKPHLGEKNMSLKEFVIYLNTLKFKEKNEFKLTRVEEANRNLANIAVIKLGNYEYTKLQDINVRKNYFIEEEILIEEKQEGDEFGEIALIKRTTRTATIKAINTCKLATIEKHDYNMIIRRMEERKFNTAIDDFRKGYRLIKDWNKTLVIKLMGNFSKISLCYGETLYEQNSLSEHIYFIGSGIFEFTSFVSKSSHKQFIDYVQNNKSSILNYIMNRGKFDENKYEEIKIELEKNVKDVSISRSKSHSKLLAKPTVESLIKMKIQEEEISQGNEIFPVKIRLLDFKDILGLEDALEFKRRFYTIKSVSQNALLYKMKIENFIHFLNHFDVNLLEINNHIIERKEVLLKQVMNTVDVKKRNEKNNIQHRYKLFIDKDGNSKQRKDLELSKPIGVKIISSEVTKSSFNNHLKNSKKISSTKKTNTNFRISSISYETIANNTLKSINNDLQIFDDSHQNANKNKRSFLISATNHRNSYTYNSSSYSNKFKRSSGLGDADFSPIKSKFDLQNYRQSLEAKNFNQIENEISKVIGSNFVNFKKNKPRETSAKTYDRDLMSIRNFNPSDGGTTLSCYDSIALEGDSRPISRNHQMFNSTQTSFFNRSENESKILISRCVSAAYRPKFVSKEKINPVSIEMEKPVINIKTFSKDKIPIEIKMKNFCKLRNKKKNNIIFKKVV